MHRVALYGLQGHEEIVFESVPIRREWSLRRRREDKMDRLRVMLCMGCLVGCVLCACALVSGQEAQEAAQETPPDTFAAEIALAAKAPDRDSRVEHLKKALELRPNDPRNIEIEYEIAIDLSQHFTPGRPEQGARPLEGLAVFAGMVQRYRHMDYYEFDPRLGSMPAGLMIPHAAILAAAIEQNVNHNASSARSYSYIAMDRLYETYLRRLSDWRSEAPPRAPTGPFADDPESLTSRAYRGKCAAYQKRQERLAEGKVLTYDEEGFAYTAVAVFRDTYRPQNAEETRRAMEVVMQKYPDSPLSEAAEKIISGAQEDQLQSSDSVIE